MAKWWSKVIGEISALRQNLFNQLGWRIYGGSYTSTYVLDSSRVDAKLARALYYNEEEKYKLGAGFAKKIINSTVGFMGAPYIRHKDEKAQEALDAFFKGNSSKMGEIHRNSLLEGDTFVWITREDLNSKLYPEKNKILRFNVIPVDMVKRIVQDPLTGEPMEYVLEYQYKWDDEQGQKRQALIRQIITEEMRKIEIEGDKPPGLEADEMPNQWGFIPIVHFRNEGSPLAVFGRSELEPVEPFIKAYHDVMLHAMQGSKMHSTPKLKFRLKDVAAFLRYNFGIDDPETFVKNGGRIDLDGHETIFLQADENAEFVEAKTAIGDANTILKLLFYCIVAVSETPEFVFGVHTPSSLSSVKEQMPVFIQKIQRKRGAFEDAWKQVARIVLAMTSQAENISWDTYETEIEWDEIDPRDGKEKAEELKIIVDALVTAVRERIMSMEAAVQYLKEYVGTMRDFETDDEKVLGEKDRIMQTLILLARMEDAPFLEAERRELEEVS